MKQVKLGSSGLTVSELCLGAMNFGTSVDGTQSRLLLDLFLEHGGSFIDTANNYAHWAPGATGDESETLLGGWIKNRGNRSRIVLATKVGFDRHGKGAGLRAAQIEHWCEESLRKLQTDYIDLYYAHVDDPETPFEETLEAFDRLLRKGKVRAIGGSNYDTWRLCEMKEAAGQRGFSHYQAIQQRFSYLFEANGVTKPYPFNEAAAMEKLRYLAKERLPLVAYSCLAGGGYADNGRLNQKYIRGERLALLNRSARELSVPAEQLVLAWMLQAEEVSGWPQIIPLFSTSREEHLLSNLQASELNLSGELVRQLCNA